MSTRMIEVNMSGWISEFKKDLLPSRQGVYLVFGGVACGTKNEKGENEAYINHLIYIGQSEDIQSRLAVSYMHLDVYKRQVVNFMILSRIL